MDKREIAKIIGKESLFMLFVTVIACISGGIQFLGRKYVRSSSGIIFSGDVYRYNYFMYIIGLIVYFIVFILVYRKYIEKYVLEIREEKTGTKILICLVCIFFAFVMFFALVFCMFAILGLGDDMIPGILMTITGIGWPAVTALYICVDVFKGNREIKE